MKLVYKGSLFVFILLFSIACENLLIEDPPNSIGISKFYKNKDDALTGLYGAYDKIYSVYDGGFGYLKMSEMNADDMTVSPNVGDQIVWDDFAYVTGVMNGLWSNCFSGINRANEVIFYTERINMNSDDKADIIAEAKALRAFFYFHLVRAMGGVPLYESPTIGFENVNKPRATEEEIYNLITRDLKDAATELNGTSPSGRINADIANALMARIFLYRGDFANALTHAREVINAERYDLFADYNDITKPGKDNGIEHIFQVQYLSGERNSNVGSACGPRITNKLKYSFWSNTVVPGGVAPSEEFIAENPDSYRKSMTMADRFEHIDGVTGTITMEEAFLGEFPYYISKFDNREVEVQSGLNFTIIRYADILLIAAEALNEVDPSDNEKYTLINRVRERARNGVTADLPELEGLSQEEFRKAVLEERRFELAFEGQRAWDLKRRGMFLQKLRAQGKNVEDYMLLFPIPDNQIKINPSLVQNPGW